MQCDGAVVNSWSKNSLGSAQGQFIASQVQSIMITLSFAYFIELVQLMQSSAL